MNASVYVRWLAGWFAALCLFFATRDAHAYPWMIRHGYTGCTPCHTDPSGGAGALAPYGRAQSDLLLRMRYGKGEGTGEADRTSQFLGGALSFPIPDELRIGGDFREAYFSNQAEGSPADQRFITMRADLYADVKVNRFRADGSIGYAPTGARAAALTSDPTDNVVSREHWVGAELDEDGSWLLRAGRIALPFGIRMIEHNLFARAVTRTDFNDSQQYGVSLAVSKDQYRAELMAIVGNFQLHPDDFRERGYSGYFEYAPVTNAAFGVSSLFTRATRDIIYGVTDYRQAHGVFARYSPAQPLVLLAEADWTYQSLTWHGHRGGYVAFAQADYEPTQGFHVMLTGEAMNGGSSGEPSSFDGWFSAVWFCLPHVDLRFDGVYTSVGIPAAAGTDASHTSVTTWLAQFHVFL